MRVETWARSIGVPLDVAAQPGVPDPYAHLRGWGYRHPAEFRAEVRSVEIVNSDDGHVESRGERPSAPISAILRLQTEFDQAPRQRGNDVSLRLLP